MFHLDLLSHELRERAQQALERAEVQRLDPRSDLYCLGLLLYELCTGRFPVTGDDVNSLIAGHLLDPIRPWHDTDPEGNIPDEVRDLLGTALRKVPEQRFQSARLFLSPGQGSHMMAGVNDTAHNIDGLTLFDRSQNFFRPFLHMTSKSGRL